MFCSTVIATINRPTLSAAVRSVLDQDFFNDDFEVIVVSDLGQPLPQMDWEQSERVHVLVTQKRERSVARNTGAAIARGKYLHFLDDDDLMAPGALQAFWEIDQRTDAAWLHGSYQSMDDDRHIIETFSPFVEGDAFAVLMAGEFVPLQASLLRADTFFAAGAYDPSFHIVEDFDLGRRIGALGPMAKTSELVALIRTGRVGSSGDWSKFAANWRRSYEKTFGQSNILRQLDASAKDNG